MSEAHRKSHHQAASDQASPPSSSQDRGRNAIVPPAISVLSRSILMLETKKQLRVRIEAINAKLIRRKKLKVTGKHEEMVDRILVHSGISEPLPEVPSVPPSTQDDEGLTTTQNDGFTFDSALSGQSFAPSETALFSQVQTPITNTNYPSFDSDLDFLNRDSAFWSEQMDLLSAALFASNTNDIDNTNPYSNTESHTYQSFNNQQKFF